MAGTAQNGLDRQMLALEDSGAGNIAVGLNMVWAFLALAAAGIGAALGCFRAERHALALGLLLATVAILTMAGTVVTLGGGHV